MSPQLLLGLVVIAIGVMMTLDNLGIVDSASYIRFWPVGVIAVGVLKLRHALGGHGGAFSGFVFLTIGTWLLLEQTTLVRLSFWDMWPTLLVFFGAFLVWQGLSRPRVKREVKSEQGDDSAVVNAVAVLGSVVRGINSTAFRGGEITVAMAGCELDLRNAEINGEAVIEVFALWGGIEIRVPDDWTVLSQVTPVLGGVEDKTRPPKNASRHRLVLRGLVIMAGIEIKN